MGKKGKILQIGILLLTVEKMLQHLLTAIFFVVDIPGIGYPDIGPNFDLSNTMMAVLNIIVFILFGAGFWGRLQGRGWHKPLLVGLAAFDIVAEFVFHGFFFITVSVIVSAILIALVIFDVNKSKM